MKIVQLIAGIFGACIFFLATWAIGSRNVNLDLTKVDQIVGQVTQKETTTRVTKKYSITQSIFRFYLDNYQYSFDTYRPSQEYSNLTRTINIGDTIKVYFRKWKNDNYVNDIYQIEKNGQVVLDYNSFNKNSTFLTGFLFFAGIFIFGYSIWKFRKT